MEIKSQVVAEEMETVKMTPPGSRKSQDKALLAKRMVKKKLQARKKEPGESAKGKARGKENAPGQNK